MPANGHGGGQLSGWQVPALAGAARARPAVTTAAAIRARGRRVMRVAFAVRVAGSCYPQQVEPAGSSTGESASTV
jgi:hypothetical protein